MGSGTIRYKLRTPWGKRILATLEVVLYALFIADCLVTIGNVASDPGSVFPAGGPSLIVLLLLISLVHRIRCGPDYS